jgi:hypothetical protein
MVMERKSVLGNLPDGIAPSCWRPAGSYAAKLCMGIGLQLADDFDYVGVIGIVQHEVTGGLYFGEGMLNAFRPDASVDQDQIEGVIGVDVDGFYILMDGGTRIIIIVDEAGARRVVDCGESPSDRPRYVEFV